MSKQKKSITVYLLSFLIIILLGIIAFLLFQRNEKKTIVVQNVEIIKNDSLEIATRIAEFKLVGQDLKKLKEEMIAMGIDKDSIGAELDEMLEALWQAEMGGAITLDDLNAKIAKSKKLLVVKDLQIKSLKEKSDSLSFEAKVLKSERESQNQKVTSMLNDTKQLSAKLNIAARVSAENIRIVGLSKKDKIIDKVIVKAKELSKLNLIFNLAENKITKKNSKIAIVFRLIKEGAIVISSETNGGGTFKTIENNELPYTQRQVVEFDDTNQEISFLYKNENVYKPGTYKIELYADGYIIGESKFTLK